MFLELDPPTMENDPWNVLEIVQQNDPWSDLGIILELYLDPIKHAGVQEIGK